MSTKSPRHDRRDQALNPGPMRGRVRIGEHSSLCKLMRAARRGLVPNERIGVIVRAMQSASERAYVFGNSKAGDRAHQGPGVRYDLRRPDTRNVASPSLVPSVADASEMVPA